MFIKPPLIDLWPFPDIPGPKDWLESLAHMLADGATGLTKQSIGMLLNYATPSLKAVQSDWFSFVQGRWLGSALNLMTVVIVLVHLLILLRPSTDHARSVTRTYTSVLLLLVEVRLFYPIYGFAITISRSAGEFVITATTRSDSKESLLAEMLKVLTPQNILGLLGSSFVGIIVQFVVAMICMALYAATLGALVLWPWTVCLRPLSNLTEKAFHFMNGVLAMGFFSPPIMIFWLCAGVWATEAADGFAGGSQYLVGFITQQVTAIFACATPFLILYGAYKVSSSVTGRLESKVEGSVNISANQPLTVKEAQQEVEESHNSFLREIVPAAAVATMDDKKGEPIARRLTDVAATAAMASGHPEAAMAANFVKGRMSDQPKEKGAKT
jgi:hypothetical protein